MPTNDQVLHWGGGIGTWGNSVYGPSDPIGAGNGSSGQLIAVQPRVSLLPGTERVLLAPAPRVTLLPS